MLPSIVTYCVSIIAIPKSYVELGGVTLITTVAPASGLKITGAEALLVAVDISEGIFCIDSVPDQECYAGSCYSLGVKILNCSLDGCVIGRCSPDIFCP